MRRPEEQLHKSVAEYLRLAAPDLLWWTVPNQRGTRARFEMGLLKALGVRAGVPDICLVLPGGRAGFIELKAAQGRPTAAQESFARTCEAIGAAYALCRSLDSVAAVLAAWGVALKGRLA